MYLHSSGHFEKTFKWPASSITNTTRYDMKVNTYCLVRFMHLMPCSNERSWLWCTRSAGSSRTTTKTSTPLWLVDILVDAHVAKISPGLREVIDRWSKPKRLFAFDILYACFFHEVPWLYSDISLIFAVFMRCLYMSILTNTSVCWAVTETTTCCNTQSRSNTALHRGFKSLQPSGNGLWSHVELLRRWSEVNNGLWDNSKGSILGAEDGHDHGDWPQWVIRGYISGSD